MFRKSPFLTVRIWQLWYRLYCVVSAAELKKHLSLLTVMTDPVLVQGHGLYDLLRFLPTTHFCDCVTAFKDLCQVNIFQLLYSFAFLLVKMKNSPFWCRTVPDETVSQKAQCHRKAALHIHPSGDWLSSQPTSPKASESMKRTCRRQSQLHWTKMFILFSAFPKYSVVSKIWINGLLFYTCVAYLQNAQRFHYAQKWKLRYHGETTGSWCVHYKRGLCFSDIVSI